MSNNRKTPRPAGDPLVTYSRMPQPPSARLDESSGPPERVEPYLNAIEIPLVDRVEPIHPADVAPDLRAVPFDMPDDLAPAAPPDIFAKKRRSWPARLLTVAALLALVVGIGVLATSFGAVTRVGPPEAANDTAAEIASIRKSIAALAGATGASVDNAREKLSELKARLAELEQGNRNPAAEADDPVPTVRKISIDGTPDPPVVAPPAPRARPEITTTSPDAGKSAAIEPEASPPDSAKAPKAIEPRKPAPPASPSAKATPTEGDDFVKNIERTLKANHPPAKRPPALADSTAPAARPALDPAPARPVAPAPTSDSGIFDGADLGLPSRGPVPPEDIPNVSPPGGGD